MGRGIISFEKGKSS
jgi:hypothetical protein